MIYSEPLYSVFVDGKFVGITDDEYEVWDIAEQSVQGIDTLLDDDVDRVQSFKIDVNRYYYDYHKYTNDKLSNDSILCYNNQECEKAVKQLNALYLQQERIEAKARALAL